MTVREDFQLPTGSFCRRVQGVSGISRSMSVGKKHAERIDPNVRVCTCLRFIDRNHPEQASFRQG